MLTAIFIIVGLSLLIIGHEAGHLLAAKLLGMKVDEFGFGFPPRIAAKRKGETEYSINWLPFGGFVKIAGESGEFGDDNKERQKERMVSKDRLFWAQPAWRRAVVIAAGVAMNFIIGWFILSLVFMIGSPSAVVVDGVQEGSPAATVGIKSGDILVGYHTTDEFIKVVDEHRGALVTFHILRDGKEMTVEAAPRVSPPAGEGALGVVLVQAGMPSEGFFAAIAGGFKESLRACGFIISALYGVVKDVLLRGETVSGDVAGPIGIVAIARGVGQIGLVYLLQLVSLISLNLAIINLVPFPALDGGRLFTILIEKIKGSPVPRRAEEIANRIGFAFLLVLMAFITVHDIARIW